MQLISFPFINYSKRVFQLVLDWGTLMIFVFILISFIYLSKYVGYLLIIFAIGYFFKILFETKTYITELIYLNENIEIHYYLQNKGPKKVILPIKSTTINWFDSVKGNISAARIVIRNKNFKITQYSVGEWKKNTLISIVEKVRTLNKLK